MSLADCVKCWDNPCTCGYEYADWPFSRRLALAAVVLGVKEDALYELIRNTPHVLHHPMKAEREAAKEKTEYYWKSYWNKGS